MTREEMEKMMNSEKFKQTEAEINHLSSILTIRELTDEACKYVTCISNKLADSCKDDDFMHALACAQLITKINDLINRISVVGLGAYMLTEKEEEEKDDGK